MREASCQSTESMRASLLDYDELVEIMIRVLTTGPERLAQLAALADPWEPSKATTEELMPVPPPAEESLVQPTE
jgi:hypothetical protein